LINNPGAGTGIRRLGSPIAVAVRDGPVPFLTRAVDDGHVGDRLINEQISYYQRRAAEYDATAYGSL